MSKLLSVNLFLLSLTVLHVSAQFPPFTKLDSYMRIEKYLAKNGCTPENAEYNIEKAKEMLKKTKCPFNFGLRNALEKFISAAEFKGLDGCSQESAELQEEIDEVVGQSSDTLPLIFKTREHFRIKHAFECRSIYPVMFRTKRQTMDNDVIAKVETFMKPEVERRCKHTDELEEKAFDLDFKTEEQKLIYYTVHDPVSDTFKKRWALNAYNAIKFYAKDDPEWKSLDEKREGDDEDKNVVQLKILFNRYIVEPCKYYTEQLAPVFEPATYDERIAGVKKPALKDENMFYLNWAYYQGCSAVMETHFQQNLLSNNVYQVFARKLYLE